jgi:hypothetical protein
LTEQERSLHQQEARRWFEQSDKQVDQWWPARPSHAMGKAIWEFREEARTVLGVPTQKK